MDDIELSSLTTYMADEFIHHPKVLASW
jgi:hypothetical protein